MCQRVWVFVSLAVLSSCPLEIIALFALVSLSSEHIFLLQAFMAPSWVPPTHLPSSGLLSFQFIYHPFSGLNSLEHKLIMSLNISDPCLPSGHNHHALHGMHLPSLQQTCMPCTWVLTSGLPFSVPGSPSPRTTSSWGAEIHFHLCIPSTGLCPAHRVSIRAPLQLVASSLTIHHDFITSFISCKTNVTCPFGNIFLMLSFGPNFPISSFASTQ